MSLPSSLKVGMLRPIYDELPAVGSRFSESRRSPAAAACRGSRGPRSRAFRDVHEALHGRDPVDVGEQEAGAMIDGRSGDFGLCADDLGDLRPATSTASARASRRRPTSSSRIDTRAERAGRWLPGWLGGLVSRGRPSRGLTSTSNTPRRRRPAPAGSPSPRPRGPAGPARGFPAGGSPDPPAGSVCAPPSRAYHLSGSGRAARRSCEPEWTGSIDRRTRCPSS